MTSDEITQAFEHPEARAQASSVVPDRISLRDHIVEVEIGAFQVERGTTQRLSFNIVVEVAAPDAPLADDVDNILSYDKVTEAIAGELAAERLNLLETLAERIAERILVQPQALRVFVRIEKLDRGPGALGVEIMRARKQVPDTVLALNAPPLVIYLDPAMQSEPALANFLTLALDAAPVVVCTGPVTPIPTSDDTKAARNIALLAADQGAWQLAARDQRLHVVSSRTELDWALNNHLLALWAPAKTVLDSVDNGPDSVTDGLAMSSWLAGILDARALLVVGAKPPSGCNIATFKANISDPVLPKLP